MLASVYRQAGITSRGNYRVISGGVRKRAFLGWISAMVSANLTQSQAIERINVRLKAVGLSAVSQTNFYRLRQIYMRQFPRSRWVVGDRLIYSQPVILYLYFLCRVHHITQSLRLTEMGARDTTSKLPGRFSQHFQTFSDIDSLFLNNVAA